MTETLATRLEQAARGAGAITFVDLRERETKLSHAELFDRASRAAAGLAARGVAPGDRVAIVAATSPEFFDGFFGAVLAGAVPVPLYPPVRLGRLDEYHERTAAMLHAARVRLVLADARTRRVLGRTIEKARPEKGCEDLGGLQAGRGLVRPLDPDALGFIQFSSGTTRAPKPVALTHRQILANVTAIGDTILAAYPEQEAIRAEPEAIRAEQEGIRAERAGPHAEQAGFRHVAASWLPLYHDMGLVGGLFTSLFHGRDLALIPPEHFIARPALWLRAISRHRATISPAPNFAYAVCVERVRDADLEGVDLSSWRVAMNGAEPVTPFVLERFVERFAAYGLREEALTPVYGLSEATLAVTFSALRTRFAVHRFDARALLEEGRAIPVAHGERGTNVRDDARGGRESGVECDARGETAIASLGPALPGFAVEIRDEAGERVGDGVLGRVHVRGPSLMSGYDGLPEETARVLVDGWLDTGDVGFLQAGELHLYGRAKDLIIVRGRNHAPQDIERALDDLPGVRPGCSAAVGALEDDGLGEALWVFVERARESDLHETEIADTVRRRILEQSGLHATRVVVLAPGTLPRTSSGKIRRSESLALYRAGRLTPPERVSLARLAVEMARSLRAFARARD
ncbi:MAG: AMP-binding protein [Deltaproteobacteria bacterium]|nr:AMP-binding protein [Deltaproteobacteria bacterium]